MAKIQSILVSHFWHLWTSRHSLENELIEPLSYPTYLLEWGDAREHLHLYEHSFTFTPLRFRFEWIHARETLISRQAMRTSLSPIENINDVSITSDDHDDKPRREIQRRSQKAFNLQDAHNLKVHRRVLKSIFTTASLLFKAWDWSIVQANHWKTLHFRPTRSYSW